MKKSGRNDLGFMVVAIWTLKYTMCSFSNCQNVIFVFYVHFKHPSRIYDASIKAADSKVPWKNDCSTLYKVISWTKRSKVLEGLLIQSSRVLFIFSMCSSHVFMVFTCIFNVNFSRGIIQQSKYYIGTHFVSFSVAMRGLNLESWTSKEPMPLILSW